MRPHFSVGEPQTTFEQQSGFPAVLYDGRDVIIIIILADCAKSEGVCLQSYLSDWSVKFGDFPDVLPTKHRRLAAGTRPSISDSICV